MVKTNPTPLEKDIPVNLVKILLLMIIQNLEEPIKYLKYLKYLKTSRVPFSGLDLPSFVNVFESYLVPHLL